MTDRELQHIIDIVLESVSTNARTIEQLTSVESLNGSDFFEVSRGRKVSFGVLKSILDEISQDDLLELRQLIDKNVLKKVEFRSSEIGADLEVSQVGKTNTAPLPVADNKQSGIITAPYKREIDTAIIGSVLNVMRFVKGVSYYTSKAPTNKSNYIVWDSLMKQFLCCSNGNYYANWDSYGSYYSNGKVRSDRVYMCEGIAYLYIGSNLVKIGDEIYAMLVAAGYQGTEDEMYVGLVGLLYESYKTNSNAPARMEHESNIDGFLGPGETATVKFTVWKGYLPITALVTKWSISRDGGDAPSDAVWNSSAKAVNFSGTIDLTVDDLSAVQQSTTFTVTAEGSFSEGAVSYNIEI